MYQNPKRKETVILFEDEKEVQLKTTRAGWDGNSTLSQTLKRYPTE